MKKIFLNTQIPDEKTAASKAKNDVRQILEKDGYESFYFPKFKSLKELKDFWSGLSKQIEKGSHLVLEYPSMPRKRMWVISAFSFLKGVKLYGLIHDIGDLRFSEAKQKSDMNFLKHFDGLISHNASMTAWLRKKGYTRPVVNLEVFDYCLKENHPFHENNISGKLKVLYAGNLSYIKATYLYDKKVSTYNNVQLDVYGQFLDKERLNGSTIRYKGAFNPDTPLLEEKYHFGLIWEGTSVDTCEGQYGHYIRFNNPHKFSLYLSLNLPVIVWKEAAIAGFVEERNIGFTVRSLEELDNLAGKMSQEKYNEYISNIQQLSEQVRSGHYLKTAIDKLTNQ